MNLDKMPISITSVGACIKRIVIGSGNMVGTKVEKRYADGCICFCAAEHVLKNYKV